MVKMKGNYPVCGLRLFLIVSVIFLQGCGKKEIVEEQEMPSQGIEEAQGASDGEMNEKKAAVGFPAPSSEKDSIGVVLELLNAFLGASS